MNTKLIINGNAVYELDVICKGEKKGEKKNVGTQVEHIKKRSEHKGDK